MARIQKSINLRGISLLLLLMSLMFGVILITKGHYTINVSPSMKLGIYKLYDIDTLERGDVVYTAIPTDIKETLLERQYIFSENINHFIKRIAAIPFDDIKVKDKYVWVNDNLYPMSYIKDYDSEGKILNSKLRNGTISEKEYLLLGDTLDSYDSRYWGTVHEKYILKKAKKIFQGVKNEDE